MLSTLVLVFLAVVLNNGQYTKEQQGMSISLFQFDPKELGIYHEPTKHKNIKRNHIKKIGKTIGKKSAIPGALADKKNESSSLLNKNPTPSPIEAEEHLKNVKFDGSKNSTVSLFKNATGIMGGGNATSNATKLPKEELLFYKNKTKVDEDGSEKVNSIKLTKSTPPEADPMPIVKVVNATTPITNNTKNATLNEKSNNFTLGLNHNLANATNLTSNLSNSTSAGNTSATLLRNNSSIAINAGTSNITNSTITNAVNSTINKNSSTVFEAKRRNEILSHFIPTMSSTILDSKDTFQTGSRKHKVHHMYPECYQCPKHSNYTECVKKATLFKCNEGLNNICFAKSNKHGSHDNDKKITYEMGCTNHTHCRNARAFPCRDGSKHCFTCCQFNKCNASPHHGDFETDDINLDELTKDKEEATKKSNASLIRVSTTLSVTMMMLVYSLM